MTSAAERVSIDDPITLGGRQTTLRQEYQLGKVALVRSTREPATSSQSRVYLAVVRQEWESIVEFRISKEDFKQLSGR